MTRLEKFSNTILRGDADSNIRFSELVNFLEVLGFELRIKGDHHIFTKQGVEEILNLQPRGSKAKGYQVKQVRKILTTYKLVPGGISSEESDEP